MSPPAAGTIHGSEISATHGMPKVEYLDYTGVTVGESTATEVAADGTWLSGPVPYISGGYSGTYYLWVSNKNADGSYSVIGVAEVQATDGSSGGGGGPPDDPPPCGSPDPCEY